MDWGKGGAWDRGITFLYMVRRITRHLHALAAFRFNKIAMGHHDASAKLTSQGEQQRESPQALEEPNTDEFSKSADGNEKRRRRRRRTARKQKKRHVNTRHWLK